MRSNVCGDNMKPKIRSAIIALTLAASCVAGYKINKISNTHETYQSSTTTTSTTNLAQTYQSNTSNETKKSSDAEKTSTTAVMSVSTRYNMTSNNHVGNDWYKNCSIEGIKKDGISNYKVSIGNQITIRTTITEDDSSVDVGRNTATRTVTQSDLKNGFTITQTITVREDKGRYAGNTATWTVTHTFKPVK